MERGNKHLKRINVFEPYCDHYLYIVIYCKYACECYFFCFRFQLLKMTPMFGVLCTYKTGATTKCRYLNK